MKFQQTPDDIREAGMAASRDIFTISGAIAFLPLAAHKAIQLAVSNPELHEATADIALRSAGAGILGGLVGLSTLIISEAIADHTDTQ